MNEAEYLELAEAIDERNAAEAKLATIRTCVDKPGYYPEERLKEIRRILNGEPAS